MPEHAASDVSRDFIDTVERAGDWSPEYVPWTADLAEQVRLEADEMIRSIAEECGVRDLNRIKPGIAEATRAILRRDQDRIYVQRRDDPDVAPICLLAAKAGVRVLERKLRTHLAITLLKHLGADKQCSTSTQRDGLPFTTTTCTT